MSIDVMREVWKHAPFKGGALLVLLAMADWADDEGGSIFPKVETLAKKARLSVRGAQLALRELEDALVIEKVVEATGRPGRATEYRIVLERVQKVQASEITKTGAVSSGDGCSLQQEGVQSEAGRVQSDAPHIDNHHPIHQEPSSDPPAPAARGNGKTLIPIPDWIPLPEWNGYLEARSASRFPIKTAHAQTLAVRELEKLRAAGHDPAEVLNQSTMNGWRGLFPLKHNSGGRDGGQSTLKPFGAAIRDAVRERAGVQGLFDSGNETLIDITPSRDQESADDQEDGPGRPAHAA